MKNPILLIFVFALLNSCQEKSIDQQAEAENLMNLSREWSQAAKDKDVDKVVSYWAEDAVLMSPDEPALIGADKLRAMVEESMEVPGFEVGWEPQEAYVSKGGDLGYVIVKNYFKVPVDTLGNMTTIHNKGVEIWKKQDDGSWKNVVDIYNGDPTADSND